MSTTLRSACLAALLALYGCGGGGSGDTPPPVTVPTVQLTLSGTVTDAAVPNATVTVHVGSDSFTSSAMTDADGAFSVDIESNDNDALVTLEATDETGTVHFMTVPTSFGELRAAADTDGGVAGLSVTNVTTAHYVLALRSTSDGEFDDLDEVENVAASVDSGELLELAAAIKTVVENRDGVTLPDGVSDTLELADGIADGSSTFLDDVEASSPGTLDDAEDDVLNDGNATVPFDAESAAGVYVDASADVMLALLDGGLGWMKSGNEVRAIGNWHVDEAGKISMVFPGGEHEVNSLTLLGQAGGFDSVVADTSSMTDGSSLGMEFATYQHSAFGDGFDEAALAGGTFVLADDDATALVFLANGSGYNADASSGAQQDSFHWQVTGDGRLVIEYDGAVVTVYHVADAAGSVLVVRTDNAGAASDVSLTQMTAAD
jgi:hypothetical protein